MNISDIQDICLPLPGTTQDIKWEDHLCFNVGEKIYLITSPDQVPHTASFKASDKDFVELTEREGFTPARYLARYKWVQVDDINRLSGAEWEEYILKSYQLVFSKLPEKVRRFIDR
jgi:predicted DNA-binding protein (MmcQ/YjbR family)